MGHQGINQIDELVAPTSATQTSKWTLLGYDTFEGGHDAFYPLPGEYVTECQAVEAALKRLAELEYSQPTYMAGGQGADGVQDHVYIVSPAEQRRRILPPRRTR